MTYSARITPIALLGLALPLLVAANAARAAEPLSLGAHGHWGGAAGLGLGGRVSWGERPALVLGCDGFFAKEDLGLRQSWRELRVDGVFHWRPRQSSLRPYVGGGMSFLRSASQVTSVPWDVQATRWSRGVNLLAGVEVSLRPRLRLYLEVRGQHWGARQVVLSSGIAVPLVR